MFTFTNHPVHFKTKTGKRSPSAFIPFCDFGQKMNKVAEKIDEFEIPVCNIFQDILLNDQLCYAVDLDLVSNQDNIIDELKLGFIFMMDYNEDRQVTFDRVTIEEHEDDKLGSRFLEKDDTQHATIYLNTIGKKCIRPKVPQIVIFRAHAFIWKWTIQSKCA